MDSITQFALGAAIGQAVLGRKEGNKAILWGGFAGTVPDLDVLIAPYMTDLQYISVHRGFSHALLFSFLASPPLAWFSKFIHKKGEGTYRNWLLLFFLCIVTHPILDSFTTYGTQLFLPFTDYRVGLNNIFIVDPLYTIPLLLSVIVCAFFGRKKRTRRIIANTGLYISCFYVALTLGLKIYVSNVMKTSLHKQGIKYEKYMTGVTPFQSVLWYCVAKTEEGAWVGYYSLFDKTRDVDFKFYEGRYEHLEPYEGSEALDRLKWFSSGYYVARKVEDETRFYDIKFGRTDVFDSTVDPDTAFVWYFKLIHNEDGEVDIREPNFKTEDINLEEGWAAIWARIQGDQSDS